MVFWAREKTKAIFAEAEARGEARGEAIGEARGMKKGRSEGEAKGTAKTDRQWRAWYERQQAAFRDGRPFDEPPPEFPESPFDGE